MARSFCGGRPRVGRRGQSGVGLRRLRSLRNELYAATEISEFDGGPLAEILASTPSGQWSLAVWRSGQVDCGVFIVASANRAALDDPVNLTRAARLGAEEAHWAHSLLFSVVYLGR